MKIVQFTTNIQKLTKRLLHLLYTITLSTFDMVKHNKAIKIIGNSVKFVHNTYSVYAE